MKIILFKFSHRQMKMILHKITERWKIPFVQWPTDETEREFVNLLRSPGIDTQPGGPVRQPYLTYRPAGLYRLAESILCNRILSSLSVYKKRALIPRTVISHRQMKILCRCGAPWSPTLATPGASSLSPPMGQPSSRYMNVSKHPAS
jgi:hypothetical protein